MLVTTNPNIWELYTGNQGSIAVGYAYETNIPLGVNSLIQAYFDDGGTTNPKHICTGDKFAYGASGFNLATGLCTDYWATASGCGALASYFRLHRRNFFLPPATTPSQASTYADYGNNPISTKPVVVTLTSFCLLSSISDNIETTESKIYPNPSTGRVIIESSIDGELKVYDLWGKQIQSVILRKKQNEILIEKSGIYLLILNDRHGNQKSTRVIINK